MSAESPPARSRRGSHPKKGRLKLEYAKQSGFNDDPKALKNW